MFNDQEYKMYFLSSLFLLIEVTVVMNVTVINNSKKRIMVTAVSQIFASVSHCNYYVTSLKLKKKTMSDFFPFFITLCACRKSLNELSINEIGIFQASLRQWSKVSSFLTIKGDPMKHIDSYTMYTKVSSICQQFT